MVVGEAPGASEDAQGIPFIGSAGEMLNRALEANEFSREDLVVTNAVKCRPPDNRDPEPEEFEACSEYLYREILDIEPVAVLTLGNSGLYAMTEEKGITAKHGIWQRVDIDGEMEVLLMPTFHPAYVLYDRTRWFDFLEDVTDFLAVGAYALDHGIDEAWRYATPVAD